MHRVRLVDQLFLSETIHVLSGVVSAIPQVLTVKKSMLHYYEQKQVQLIELTGLNRYSCPSLVPRPMPFSVPYCK